jgi:flagellar assembly protein FliH
MALNKKSSRILTSGSQDDYEAWEVPDVQILENPHERITVEELERVQKQAYDEGFNEGRADGYEVGQKEGFSYGHQEGMTQSQQVIESIISKYNNLIDFLDEPFNDFDQEVEQQVMFLAMEMAKRVIDAELKTQPELIINAIRKAIALLPISARDIKIKLNPQDHILLKEANKLAEFADNQKIIDDPYIQQGGCEVMTNTSTVDAKLSSRINEVIATVLNCDVDDVKQDQATESDEK